MAMEMPKLSASRPAWSMNGSRWRRVSHTASGPMTDPKGTISPAKVDRWAATAVLRISSSTAPISVVSLPPSAARLAPQCGQVGVCWSSLAEQAGHVLDIDCSLVGALPWAPVGDTSTIGRQAGCVVGPGATLGCRPAGEAADGCHPPGGAGSSATVNPACMTGRCAPIMEDPAGSDGTTAALGSENGPATSLCLADSDRGG